MPFKSQQQREACFAQEARDKKAGRKPGWNCRKWEKETPSRIPGMKKESSDRFATAFQDELAKLSAKGFATSAQRLAKFKKPPAKKPQR